MQYDHTAYMIETPDGLGRFVEYDGVAKMAIVEMDHSWLVAYPAEESYIIQDEREETQEVLDAAPPVKIVNKLCREDFP